MAGIDIGTSGWHYGSRGPFYPKGMKPRDFPPFYAERFDVTEINNTFHRLPARETLARWRAATSPT